jgi:DNA-binding HxlR family transcriptional regulator
MRSYGQYCSVGKALDVVGDQWTLLIIRELLAQGPCRYTDLENGLPGIATNLLSDRLRGLESAGLVRREEAGPPVATALLSLTAAGEELKPVLAALSAWSVRYMTEPEDGEEVRGHWLSLAASFFLHDRDPAAPPASIELRTTARPAVIEISGGQVRTRLGPAPAPDLVLSGSPRLMLGLLMGYCTPSQAQDLGPGVGLVPAVACPRRCSPRAGHRRAPAAHGSPGGSVSCTASWESRIRCTSARPRIEPIRICLRSVSAETGR